MKRFLALALAVTAPAYAQDLPAEMRSMQTAQQLGNILSSEELCALTLDPQKIEAWIAANVEPGDMAFASNLQMMIAGAGFTLSQMTASATTAHCAAVRQSAAHANLLRD